MSVDRSVRISDLEISNPACLRVMNVSMRGVNL